jgi:hypothetical protein
MGFFDLFNSGPFGPFKDFKADKVELASWATLDRAENLARRLAHFTKQNPSAVQRSLGFVPLIAQNRFTCVGVPGERGKRDLVCSVGLFYSFGYPDLMLRGDDDQATVERLQPVIEAVGRRIAAAEDTGPVDLDRPDARAILNRRAPRLAAIVQEELRAAGLKTDRVRSPDRAFLDDYAYGYGFYFYCHFLKPMSVPLLMAGVKT